MKLAGCVVVVAALLLPACAPTPPPTATPAPKPADKPAAAASAPVNPVAAPAGAAIRITAPAAGAAVPAGDVVVSYDVGALALVPGAEAKKPEDLHVHVLLDVDPAPYIGTTTFIPPNSPQIVHTAAKEVTFKDVKAGEHKVAIILTSPDHVSVRPPVTATSAFTAR